MTRQTFETRTPSGHLVTFFNPTPMDVVTIRKGYDSNSAAFSLDETVLAYSILEVDGLQFNKGDISQLYLPFEYLKSFKDLDCLTQFFRPLCLYATQADIVSMFNATHPKQILKEDLPASEPTQATPPTEANGAVLNPV